MIALPVTSATAAVCALFLVVLSLHTVRQRLRAKVGFGDGGDQGLVAAIRSHGNFAEHAPFVLILMALLEFGGADQQLLAGFATAFLLGRGLHVIGMHTVTVGKPPRSRQIGVILTWVTLIGLSVMLLMDVFGT